MKLGAYLLRPAGAELLGVENRAAAETEILSLTVEALHAAGLDNFDVKLGDLSLFSAFVDALDIPPQWRGRLKRHFWRSGYFGKNRPRVLARLHSIWLLLPMIK